MKNVEDHVIGLTKITNLSYDKSINFVKEYGVEGAELYLEMAKMGNTFEDFKIVYKEISLMGWEHRDDFLYLFGYKKSPKTNDSLAKFSKELDEKRKKLKKELFIKKINVSVLVCLIIFNIAMIGVGIFTLFKIDPMIAAGATCLTVGVSGLLVRNGGANGRKK